MSDLGALVDKYDDAEPKKKAGRKPKVTSANLRRPKLLAKWKCPLAAREERARSLGLYLLLIAAILDGLQWGSRRSPLVVGVEIGLSVAIILAAIVSEALRWLRDRRESN